MKTRFFLSVLALVIGGSAEAGSYQHTRYTHVRVWSDQPRFGQEATWSGGKDAAGYGTGYGTLTWYAPDKPPVTGSNIPARIHMKVVSSYTDTMVRGKFVGPTNAGNAPPASKPQTERNKPPPSPESTPPAEKKPSAKESATPTPSATIAASASPGTSSSPSPSPAPSATATPAGDSLNSLTHPPSSLNLNTPAETSPSPQESASPSPLL